MNELPMMPSAPSGNNKILAWGAGIVILLALACIVLYAMSFFPHKTPPAVFNPTGTLYLSLSPATSAASGIYSYAFSSNTLTKLIGSSGSIDLSPSLTPNGLVYTSNDIGSTDGTYLKIPQLFVWDAATASSTQISATASLAKRYPKYSAALNEYIYEARDAALPNLSNTTPDASTVYLLTSPTHGMRITSGAAPVLTPDGKSVVVLRSDGLYMTSLAATSTALKIWGVESGTMATQDQFNISPDGKMIAWAIPDKGHLYIMAVASWAPFSGRVTDDIPVTALFPLFSPDNAYLAYVQIDVASSTPSNPRLTIRNLASGEARATQTLDTFSIQSMYLTGWEK
jgi:hypothetical protein